MDAGGRIVEFSSNLTLWGFNINKDLDTDGTRDDRSIIIKERLRVWGLTTGSRRTGHGQDTGQSIIIIKGLRDVV
jgi:hypothetical protein